MNRFHCLFAIILFGYGQSIFAGAFPLPGPGASTEAWDDPDSSDAAGPVLRADAWVYAPIPVRFFSGLLTVNASYQYLRSPAKSSSTNQHVSDLGFLWHPHHKEGAPRYYLSLARKGSLKSSATVGPASVFTVGSDIGDDDLPFRLSFTAADVTETRLYGTVYRFPFGYKFDGGLGHAIRSHLGLTIDLLIPHHAYLGYRTSDRVIDTYFGVARDTDYVVDPVEKQGHWISYQFDKRLVALTWMIHEPFYLTVEAGRQRISKQTFLSTKEVETKPYSPFVSYAKLSLATWFRVP